MTLPMRHRLSPTATRDVARLYRVSILSFGLAHADRYLLRLKEAFRGVGEHPEANAVRKEYRGNVRIKRFEAHHIVYRVLADEVVVVRVLHGRQDIMRNV